LAIYDFAFFKHVLYSNVSSLDNMKDIKNSISSNLE